MHEQLLELQETLVSVGATIDEEADTITNAINHIKRNDKIVKDYTTLVQELVTTHKQVRDVYFVSIQMLCDMVISATPKNKVESVTEMLHKLESELAELN